VKLPLPDQVVPAFMEYSYVPNPPDGDDTVIVPFAAPLQIISVSETTAASTGGPVITSAPLSILLQPVAAASLIRTSYVPGLRPVKLPVPTQVTPPSIVYPYVPDPPPGAEMVIVPFAAPKQKDH